MTTLAAHHIPIVGTREQRRWILEDEARTVRAVELKLPTAIDSLCEALGAETHVLRLVSLQGDIPADMIVPLQTWINAGFERDEAAAVRRSAGLWFVGSMADRGAPLARIAEMLGVSQVRATHIWTDVQKERATDNNRSA